METYLFFGSFNPFHNGHLALARHILANTVSDLWLIVSPHNPHKDPTTLAPFEDRLAMVKAAAIDPRILALDIENSLPRPSYTINTIQTLRSLYPNRKFTILAGSDIASTIHTWYRYDLLKTMANVAIYPRHESDRPLCSPIFQDAPILELSSTDFRTTKNLDFLPPAVASYISTHHLYGL